jgi:hypothetical protein
LLELNKFVVINGVWIWALHDVLYKFSLDISRQGWRIPASPDTPSMASRQKEQGHQGAQR